MTDSKAIWLKVIRKHFTKNEAEITDKLSRARFDKAGNILHSKDYWKKEFGECGKRCIGCYVNKHIPNIYQEYKIKLQAQEIPCREKRIKIDMFTERQKQMSLDKPNQLNLFRG